MSHHAWQDAIDYDREKEDRERRMAGVTSIDPITAPWKYQDPNRIGPTTYVFRPMPPIDPPTITVTLNIRVPAMRAEEV